MKYILFSVAALAMTCSLALADAEVSADEATKIKDVLAKWGCEGGTLEKESEATGVLEAEDVTCKSGQYDFRLNKDYTVFAITKD